MTAAEVQFTAGARVHATSLYDQHQSGRTEFSGNLNFSAHRQANDQQYLGIIGKNYYAKPWGNDSSNIQAILNGPAYWKRVYYRPNVAAQFYHSDKAAAAKEASDLEEMRAMAGEAASRPATGASSSKGGMRRTSSEPSVRKGASSQLQPLDEEPADGYASIKAKMKPFVESGGKPKIKAPSAGERLNFHNTLGHKYHMKAGGKNIEWNVSKGTHRSTPAEQRWILSNYFRSDTQAVLSGCGSEPILAKTQ